MTPTEAQDVLNALLWDYSRGSRYRWGVGKKVLNQYLDGGGEQPKTPMGVVVRVGPFGQLLIAMGNGQGKVWQALDIVEVFTGKGEDERCECDGFGWLHMNGEIVTYADGKGKVNEFKYIERCDLCMIWEDDEAAAHAHRLVGCCPADWWDKDDTEEDDTEDVDG